MHPYFYRETGGVDKGCFILSGIDTVGLLQAVDTAVEMVKNGDIRLLALDGVEPSRETIRDGSYPVSNNFYAVTAAPVGEPAPHQTDDTLGAFLNWILSDQGQELIEKTGYVSLN